MIKLWSGATFLNHYWMLNSEAHCERHCKARLRDVQLLGQFKLLTLKVLLCQQLWAILMYDTPSLVSIGLWRSQSLQNDYWVMAVRHGQFRPFHKVWLLRDDCMKFHKVRTNLAKTWQNMTQMLLNVALLRAHVHLLFLVATGGRVKTQDPA